MKRFMVGMVMSAAITLSPMALGCGGECDNHCDKFIKCMKDMWGGKLKETEGWLKEACKKECKKDEKKFTKSLKALCGGDECNNHCDKFIICMKDMSGGKLKEDEGRLRKECKKECKKDEKKFTKSLKALCGS